MSVTYQQAVDEMLATLRTAWLADAASMDYPILYWDVAYPAEPTTPWCRVTVQHQDGAQVTLSNESGARRFRRYGLITVQIFTEWGKNTTLKNTLKKIVCEAFEGVTTSPGRVTFRNVRPNEIGQDGQWFQTNVLAEFEYDEVR